MRAFERLGPTRLAAIGGGALLLLGALIWLLVLRPGGDGEGSQRPPHQAVVAAPSPTSQPTPSSTATPSPAATSSASPQPPSQADGPAQGPGATGSDGAGRPASPSATPRPQDGQPPPVPTPTSAPAEPPPPNDADLFAVVTDACVEAGEAYFILYAENRSRYWAVCDLVLWVNYTDQDASGARVRIDSSDVVFGRLEPLQGREQGRATGPANDVIDYAVAANWEWC